MYITANMDSIVKGNDIKADVRKRISRKKNVSVEFKERKMKICTIIFIAEEICSWLSPLNKQTTSPFSPPTKVIENVIEFFRTSSALSEKKFLLKSAKNQ